MKKEEKEAFYEVMKKNPSLEPIADLMVLVEKTKQMAKESEEIGDRLSVLATQAETGAKEVPAIEPWMNLCDFYKEGARQFAASLKAAAKCSRISQLPQRLKEYNNETFERLLFMKENDPHFKRLWGEAFGEREEEDDIDE